MRRRRGPRPLVAGNWKMNGTSASLAEARAMAQAAKGARLDCEIMLCPPATLIAAMARALRASRIASAARTAMPSRRAPIPATSPAAMLVDAGAPAPSSSAIPSAAPTTARPTRWCAPRPRPRTGPGLTAIVCVGETEARARRRPRARRGRRARSRGSLPRGATAANTVIAYEPVWAIGTGRTPTPDDVAEVHAHIRARLNALVGADGDGFRILYGGSVKPANAAELLAVANVDGALVGGASLKAGDFIAIVMSYA